MLFREPCLYLPLYSFFAPMLQPLDDLVKHHGDDAGGKGERQDLGHQFSHKTHSQYHADLSENCHRTPRETKICRERDFPARGYYTTNPSGKKDRSGLFPANPLLFSFLRQKSCSFFFFRGIISTVAAHVRQDTVYSVVLFTKRLLLILHYSKNQQS